VSDVTERKIAITISVPANWEERMDMQYIVEREISADRWLWNWPSETTNEIDRLRARVAELEAERVEPLRNADTPRADLLDKSLREYAHKRRIEACCAWSDVKNNDGSLNEAKCNYASAKEAYLKSAIDELADLSTKPAPTMDVDAISDEALNAAWSYIIFNAENEQTEAVYDMRAALRAIFNKGE
jgi:hypothetical protein